MGLTEQGVSACGPRRERFCRVWTATGGRTCQRHWPGVAPARRESACLRESETMKAIRDDGDKEGTLYSRICSNRSRLLVGEAWSGRSVSGGQSFPPWLATYIASSTRLQTPIFVERATLIVPDHWFRGANDLCDRAIGQILPQQNRDLNSFTVRRSHGVVTAPPLWLKIAMANLTPMRPSRIPARKNSVRRC
jgi:hypothetical protein